MTLPKNVMTYTNLALLTYWGNRRKIIFKVRGLKKILYDTITN